VLSALHIHLVFVTKNRGVLTGKHIRYLNGISGKVCSDFGAVLAERNGQDDHVHLLAGYPPKACVATLADSLNEVSARPSAPGTAQAAAC